MRRIGRKTGVGALGGVVMAAGVVMLVTPGPGLATMALGLAILSREFPFARRQLSRLRRGRSAREGETDGAS